eukprot:GHVR01134815.1.p1 GENE.GHVR01134815.1~~GHVR01134815.1.p1  ORF type:complete len:114 (+),score=21.45 GHVR01134815.1:263-604(+)
MIWEATPCGPPSTPNVCFCRVSARVVSSCTSSSKVFFVVVDSFLDGDGFCIPLSNEGRASLSIGTFASLLSLVNSSFFVAIIAPVTFLFIFFHLLVSGSVCNAFVCVCVCGWL